MAFTSLGGTVGPYVTGFLVQNSSNPASGFHASFQVCALLLLIFGGLAWVAVRPKKFENTSNELLPKEIYKV